ncbi:MAG: AMP-binding protein, partial [Bacteroidetes bacterium]|nr:AMP-binding protein [Bacteroidota bacterium]
MAAIVEFDTLPQLFHSLVERNRGKNTTALQYKDRDTKEWTAITWDALETRVYAVAGYLHAMGVRKGDRVAILSENRPEWAIADLATQLLGGINVSLYTSLPSSQVEYIIRDSGSKLFFVSTKLQLRKALDTFDNCPDLERVVSMSELETDTPEYVTSFSEAETSGMDWWKKNADEISGMADVVTADDIAALIYTSGTTGTPKGVMLTHGNFSTNARAALTLVPFGPGDHHLSFLPLCHSFERTAGYTAVLAAGGKISYAESIDTVSRNLVELSPTVMISVPRLFEKIYNAILKSAQEGSAFKKAIFDWSVDSGKAYSVASRNGGTPGPLLALRNAIAQRAVFSKLHAKLGGNLRFAVSGGAALPKEI